MFYDYIAAARLVDLNWPLGLAVAKARFVLKLIDRPRSRYYDIPWRMLYPSLIFGSPSEVGEQPQQQEHLPEPYGLR